MADVLEVPAQKTRKATTARVRLQQNAHSFFQLAAIEVAMSTMILR